MRTIFVAMACVLSTAGVGAQAHGQKMSAPPAAGHVLLTPGDMKWGAAPPVLPAGAQMAVLSGDPSKAGFFVLRLKFPDGYKIAAHWHPTDENITVVEGMFQAGMGDAFSDAALHEFPAGSYVKMPRRVNHFASAKGDVVVQIDGQGPFVVNYVNPKDDPTKKTVR